MMGVVNVTPDSFSDGGNFIQTDKAIDHALRLSEEGASILDVGGESTRPNAEPVSVQEELDRVIPVIEALAKQTNTLISIDTRHADVMRSAVKVGAGFINDVNALQNNSSGLKFIAEEKLPVCLMHMQNTPQDMQENPIYEDVIQEVFEFLSERIRICVEAGISKDLICADVGIGFGKTLEHNLTLLKNIEIFHGLGVPLLLGVSRKRFIEKISGSVSPQKRLGGSIASALYGFQKGVKIFRVHDVEETKQAFQVFQAIQKSS